MPNHPTLDASVQWRIDHGTIDLREPGYRGTAEAILDAGLATEVRRLISAGKEADVYLCAYNGAGPRSRGPRRGSRSEEHTSELQSQSNLLCRPLLEKKKKE